MKKVHKIQDDNKWQKNLQFQKISAQNPMNARYEIVQYKQNTDYVGNVSWIRNNTDRTQFVHMMLATWSWGQAPNNISRVCKWYSSGKTWIMQSIK